MCYKMLTPFFVLMYNYTYTYFIGEGPAGPPLTKTDGTA
jgi:hypothetical protein